MRLSALPGRSFMRRRARNQSIFILFAFVLFFFFSSHLIFAQENQNLNPTPYPLPASSENPLNTNPDVEKNLHNGAQIILIETLSALSCQITGVDPTNRKSKCLGVDSNNGKIGFVENGGGAIGAMSTLISYTFTPPASGFQYISYLKSNFGIVKPTYAAADPKGACSPDTGIGFCSIEPILELWVAMRNLTYLILILVFVLIGLAIMLRVHIDPRTVMTVQNQIPKIIIGIVMISFSFAISGFLIDVMYTSSYLIGNIIADAPLGKGTPKPPVNKVINASNPFEAAHYAYDGGVLAVVGDSSRMVNNFIDEIFNTPNPSTGVATSDTFNDGAAGFAGWIFHGIIGILAFLIIGVGVLYVLLRLWIILITAYVSILLDIIFSPFWFLMGLLPGSTMGLGAWFRDMIANLSVFPATVIMLLLANYFAHAFDAKNANSHILFSPPVLANTQSASTVSAIIALGFFFMMPSILTIMKGALKAPKLAFGPVFKPAAIAAAGLGGLPKRGFALQEKYAYNQAGGLSRWQSLVTNPLLREGKKPKTMEGSGHPPTAGGAKHG